jgi:HK97 family phage portal protein
LFEKIKRLLGVEKKSFAYNLGDASPGTMGALIAGNSGIVTPYQAANLYRTSSAIAIAVDTVMDEVEQIKPVLKIGDQYIDDHEVLSIINRPNPFETRQQFISQLGHDWLLNHDAFIAMAGNVRSAPVAMYSTTPQFVNTYSDSNDRYPQMFNVYQGLLPGNYKRWVRGREPVRFIDGNLKELYHLRGYSSHAYFTRGDSPLNAILLEAQQHIHGRYHNLRLLQNGGRLSLVAIFKDRLKADEVAERRQLINEQMAGSDNAGKIAVMSADDMELQEFGKSNKDMDYTVMDRVVFHTTMLRYKIPLPLVTNDASTFNNMKEGVTSLYDRAVIPTYKTIANHLGKALLPRYGIDPAEAQITYNPESIEPLMMRRLEELEKRKNIGVETPNELRSLLPNREPIPGGDDIYHRASDVPIGTDIYTDDNATSAEEQARLRIEENEDNPQ